MKFRVWLQIYPHQMADSSQFKPYVSATPIPPAEGSRILAFDAEVPDDLFGVKQVEAVLVSGDSGDKEP